MGTCHLGMVVRMHARVAFLDGVSTPPQLGDVGFCRLTFGNDPLTQTLQRISVNLFGDEGVFGDDVERISSIIPSPDSQKSKRKADAPL